MHNNLQICLITGFLGAGKTSLLRKQLLLKPSTPFALFVNDFGDVSIDASLIASVLPDPLEQVVELSNGCVCCLLAGALLEKLKNHAQNFPKIKKIFIELSGTSNPAGVIKAIRSSPEVSEQVSEIKTVCVMDAKNFNRETASSLSLLQAGCADVFYISKTDLPLSKNENAQFESFLHQINPMAFERKKTVQDTLSLDWFFKSENDFKTQPNFENTDYAFREMRQWSYRWAGSINPAWIQKLLRSFSYDHPGKVVRMKAILKVEPARETWSIQGVSDLYEKEILPSSNSFSKNEIVVFAYGQDLDSLVQSIKDHFSLHS